MANAAWGIDLGNRALKAVKLVRDGAGYRVDDFEVIEHEQILSTAGDNRESMLQTALAHFVERHNTKGMPVGVAVSGQSSFARFIKLPPVEPKKIPEIVKFEAIQQIPFPLDDVEWAYQLFQNDQSPDVEVGIFAMRKELVNKQIAYFTSLGLNVQVVQMHPLAVYNGMYYDDQVGQTTMFMDCGSENTDLIIADGQTAWLRTLQIGGNNFTETLAKSFKLTFQKAEELKRTAATSKYAKQIFQAMRPVFADLVSEIQRSMGFYASVHRDAQVARIVALGGTFQLPGLQKYLQQNLSLPVEKIDTVKAQAPADGKAAATFTENLGSLAGAYGLALQALGEGKITSSLLPESIRRAKMWKEKTKWFGLAAACFVAGTVAAYARYYVDEGAYEGNSGVRDQIVQTKNNAKHLATDWKQGVEEKGNDDRTKLLNLSALLEYRDLWPNLLADIDDALPKLSLEKQKSMRRGDRKTVEVRFVQSSYHADLSRFLDPNLDLRTVAGSELTASGVPTASYSPAGGGGFGGVRGGARMEDETIPEDIGSRGGTAATPADQGPVGKYRGFIIQIRGSTPRGAGLPGAEGAKFIDQEIVKKLNSRDLTWALNTAAPKQYYVARASLVNVGARRPADPKNQRSPDEIGIEGEPAAGVVRPVDPAAAVLAPEMDRFFPTEVITADTDFTVLLIVVLDPTPPAAEPK